MHVRNLFIENNRLRAAWRILLFTTCLALVVAPLTLLENYILQLSSAVVILILVLWLTARYIDHRKFEDYGLVLGKFTLPDFLAGLAGGCIAVFIMLALGQAAGFISVSTTTTSTVVLTPLLVFGFKMFLVGLWEEVIFRGYLFTNLKDGFTTSQRSKFTGAIIALLLSSVVFGLAHSFTDHASVRSVLLLSLNGAVWCIPFLITGNLWLPVGLHIAWNITQTLTGFTMSGNSASMALLEIIAAGPDWWTGGAYGPEAGLLGLTGFLFMMLYSLLYLRLTRGRIQLLSVFFSGKSG